MLEFGGAEGPGVASRCSEAMVGEVASSSSSTTLTTTVASLDRVIQRHQISHNMVYTPVPYSRA